MNRKKALTVLLAFAVLAIWGKIIWEVVQREPGENLTPLPPSSYSSSDNEKPVQLPQELSLNYPDPFLKSSLKRSSLTSSSRPRTKSPTPTLAAQPTKPLNWPELVYLGRMKPLRDENGLAILRHKNDEFIIAPGESLMDCEVKNVYADSVIIAKEGQTKTLRK